MEPGCGSKVKVGTHDPYVRPVLTDGSRVTALWKAERGKAIGTKTGQAKAGSQSDRANKGTVPLSILN